MLLQACLSLISKKINDNSFWRRGPPGDTNTSECKSDDIIPSLVAKDSENYLHYIIIIEKHLI